MNRQEYLLACLMEECGEVIQSCGKALRFGLDSNYGTRPTTNRDDILNEFNDVFAIMHMLRDEGIYNTDIYKVEHIQKKIDKVNRFMLISEELGTVRQ